MLHGVYPDYLEQWASEVPGAIWLRDRSGDDVSEWSWARARAEIDAVAAWLEERFGTGVSMAILSRNRAHWFLADFAIIASGNVAIPIFTTIPAPSARYVLDFSRVKCRSRAQAPSTVKTKPRVNPDSGLPSRSRVLGDDLDELGGRTQLRGE